MKEIVYTDQTEKFTVQSSKGHGYIIIMVEIDAKYIDAKPMKNRTEDEMIISHQVLLKLIPKKGMFSSKTHISDNEASAVFSAKLSIVGIS